LNELFTSGIVSMVGDVFSLAGIVVALFLLNAPLALVTFLTLPMIIVFTGWFRKRSRETYRDIRVRLARINAFLQEHITGMAVVQLFNRESDAREDFSKINDSHRDLRPRDLLSRSSSCRAPPRWDSRSSSDSAVPRSAAPSPSASSSRSSSTPSGSSA
jgi:ATP-binding cassette subfamily B protein